MLNDLLLALDQFRMNWVFERYCESAEASRVQSAGLLLLFQQLGLVGLLLVPFLHLFPVQLLQRFFEVSLQLFKLVCKLGLHALKVDFVLLVDFLPLQDQSLFAVHVHLVEVLAVLHFKLLDFELVLVLLQLHFVLQLKVLSVQNQFNVAHSLG